MLCGIPASRPSRRVIAKIGPFHADIVGGKVVGVHPPLLAPGGHSRQRGSKRSDLLHM